MSFDEMEGCDCGLCDVEAHPAEFGSVQKIREAPDYMLAAMVLLLHAGLFVYKDQDIIANLRAVNAAVELLNANGSDADQLLELVRDTYPWFVETDLEEAERQALAAHLGLSPGAISRLGQSRDFVNRTTKEIYNLDLLPPRS